MRGEGTSHEAYRWKLVEDFVTNFNEYCTQLFSTSDIICDNDSILRWYGQGGNWINLGLQMYVTMDRKTENGEEIQNAACGRSVIMMRLRIVESERNEEEQEDHEENTPHGTKVLKDLVIPWANIDRIICADS